MCSYEEANKTCCNVTIIWLLCKHSLGEELEEHWFVKSSPPPPHLKKKERCCGHATLICIQGFIRNSWIPKTLWRTQDLCEGKIMQNTRKKGAQLELSRCATYVLHHRRRLKIKIKMNNFNPNPPWVRDRYKSTSN